MGRATAFPPALIHLEVGSTEIIAAIVLCNFRNAALAGGLPPGVENLPADAALLHPQFAITPVEFISTVLVTPMQSMPPMKIVLIK